MRILCLTPWFPDHKQDQHGNYILDSVESLVELGHELVVLVTRPWRPAGSGFIKKEWATKKIQFYQFSEKYNLHACHYLSIPNYIFPYISHESYRKRVNPLLEKLIRRFGCQLIHAHTELSGVSAVDVGMKYNIPSLVTLHGISTEPKLYNGSTKKLFYDYALKNTNRVVMVGDPLIHFFKKFIPTSEHFRVVYNGFRINQYNKIQHEKIWPNSVLRFISVSNLAEGKGIDINLYALAKIKSKGITNWTYKIVGDGNEKDKLKKIAKQLNLLNHVSFAGACQHDEVYYHLHQADIFILPSYREAFGIAYIEAMSCGLLAVAVKGQGAEAFIEHEKTGFLVLPKDSDSLATTLKRIFDFYSQAQKIANAGRYHVHNHFTWQQHAKQLTTVYQELVSV